MSALRNERGDDGGRRGGESGGRRRHPPRRVEVVSVSRLTPRLVSVRLGGDDLDGFENPAPTSHIKVHLPHDGQSEPVLEEMTSDGPAWPTGGSAPVSRTYTPRSFDPVTRTLEVQFALHGEGPASEWATRATPGDRLAISGPGGRFNFDPGTTRWWIAGDESAIPATGTVLDALPAGARAEVHLEVEGAEDEIEFASAANLDVYWHHRRSPDEPGAELNEAARYADLEEGTRVWAACEAAAVRRIRRRLLDGRGLRPESIVTRGYWRLGETNHPDGDYGDDA
jgi:NADPH-dependent ferric siderophore reductase